MARPLYIRKLMLMNVAFSEPLREGDHLIWKILQEGLGELNH